MTVWNTSPSMMCFRVASTAFSYTSLGVRNRSSGCLTLVSRALTRASPGVGVAAFSCMRSSRLTAWS